MIEDKKIALLQKACIAGDSILNRDSLKNKSERFDRVLQLYQHMLNIAREYIVLHNHKATISGPILVKVLLESYANLLNTIEIKDYYKAQIWGHFQDLKKQIQSTVNESNDRALSEQLEPINETLKILESVVPNIKELSKNFKTGDAIFSYACQSDVYASLYKKLIIDSNGSQPELYSFEFDSDEPIILSTMIILVIDALQRLTQLFSIPAIEINEFEEMILAKESINQSIIKLI